MGLWQWFAGKSDGQVKAEASERVETMRMEQDAKLAIAKLQSQAQAAAAQAQATAQAVVARAQATATVAKEKLEHMAQQLREELKAWNANITTIAWFCTSVAALFLLYKLYKVWLGSIRERSEAEQQRRTDEREADQQRLMHERETMRMRYEYDLESSRLLAENAGLREYNKEMKIIEYQKDLAERQLQGVESAACMRDRDARELALKVISGRHVLGALENGSAQAGYAQVSSSSHEAHMSPADSISQVGARNPHGPTASQRPSSTAGGQQLSPDDVRSSVSMCSLVSATGPKCFLPATLLESPNGQFMRVEQLVEGSFVKAANGRLLRVMGHFEHRSQPQTLVELIVASTSICVTGTHRIVADRDGRDMPVPASELQVGDRVQVADACSEPVMEVRFHFMNTEVYEVYLDPDEPVAAFHLPARLVSMGATHVDDEPDEPDELDEPDESAVPVRPPASRRTRRSRMNRRGRSNGVPSMPETYDSYR